MKILRLSVNVKSLFGHNVNSMSVEYEFKNMKLKFQAGDLIGHSSCTTIPEMTTFVVSLALNRAWLRILEKQNWPVTRNLTMSGIQYALIRKTRCIYGQNRQRCGFPCRDLVCL